MVLLALQESFAENRLRKYIFLCLINIAAVLLVSLFNKCRRVKQRNSTGLIAHKQWRPVGVKVVAEEKQPCQSTYQPQSRHSVCASVCVCVCVRRLKVTLRATNGRRIPEGRALQILPECIQMHLRDPRLLHVDEETLQWTLKT